MSKPKTIIIDYGMGNLFSIEWAVRHVGGDAEISDSPLKIAATERLILPGVGAFGEAMGELKKRGILESIYDFIQTERPLMGICLGMQLLMTEGYEFGLHQGLDIISGKVVQLKGITPDGQKLKVPHIGWNTINIPPPKMQAGAENSTYWDNTILQGLIPGSYFYFVHSFACYPDNAKHALAESNYGTDSFCSVVHKDYVYGCQFHPERSGNEGLQIYKNFLFKI